LSKEEVRKKIVFTFTVFGLMIAFLFGLMLIQIGSPRQGGYTPTGEYIPPREGNPWALGIGYLLIFIVVAFGLKMLYDILIRWSHWRFDLIFTRVDRNPRNNYLIKAGIVSVDPLTSAEVKAALGCYIPEPIAYYDDKIDWRIITYTGEETGIMIVGSLVPYEALGEHVPDSIYIGNIPVRTNVRDLEAVELIRISWDSVKIPKIPPELKRKLAFLPRKKYNLLEPEVTTEFFDHKTVPVLIIVGSSEIAQQIKEGVFAIPLLGETPEKAKETLEDIIGKAKARILDVSEAEKKTLREAMEQIISKRTRLMRFDQYANPPKILEGLPQPTPPSIKIPTLKTILKIIGISLLILMIILVSYLAIKAILGGVIP